MTNNLLVLLEETLLQFPVMATFVDVARLVLALSTGCSAVIFLFHLLCSYVDLMLGASLFDQRLVERHLIVDSQHHFAL